MSTLTGHATATNPQQRHRKEAGIPLFIDASALAPSCGAAISRRGPVRRRQPGAVRHRRLELPPGADRRRDPARARTT